MKFCFFMVSRSRPADGTYSRTGPTAGWDLLDKVHEINAQSLGFTQWFKNTTFHLQQRAYVKDKS